MIFRNKYIRRLLAAVMAMVTCFALALAPAATEGDANMEGTSAEQTQQTETAQATDTAAKDKADATAEGEASTEDSASEEAVPEVTEPAVTEEEFLAAWEALTIQLDQQTLDLHAEAFDNIAKNPADYAREDVMKALDVCGQAIAAEKMLEVDLLQILDRLNTAAELEDGEKNSYVTYFEDGQLKLEQDPVYELVMSVTGITPGVQIDTAKNETYLQELKTLAAAVKGTNALLDNYRLWNAVELELANLSGYEMTDSVRALYQPLADEFEGLKKSREAFLTLSAEEQMAVPAALAVLAQKLETFHVQVTMVNNGLIRSLEGRIAALEGQLTTLSGKLLFAYIALAIGITALIMAVVAAVCTLRKPKDETFDISSMASRKDAEALNQQNQILRRQLDQLDKKVDLLVQDQKKKPAPAPKPEPAKPEAPKTEKKKPVKEVSLGSSKVVCRLALKYQTINAANSYLTRDTEGSFVLYDDNTLALHESEMQISNEFKDWKNSGLLYLFNAQVDGNVLDADRDNLPAGYFETSKMVARAQVTPSGDGRFNLKRRGVISMTR